MTAAKKTVACKPGVNAAGIRSTELFEARRRYANARRRARYWSGTPNFDRRVRSNKTRSSVLWEKYELAMCDCRNWEETIEELTGKKPKRYDPKQAFAHAFHKAVASNGKADARESASVASSALMGAGRKDK